MWRVVCMSDTHGKHRKIRVPDGDIIVMAGDAASWGRLSGLWDFFDWFAELPHEHKIVVAGNHDAIFEDNPDLARSRVPPGVQYLEAEGCEVEGLKIWGAPWAPRFAETWQAFCLPRKKLKKKWAQMPKGLDISISHGPPSGVGKTIFSSVGGGGRDVGDDALREAILEKQPRLHVCGHVHVWHGAGTIGKTKVISAPICNIGHEIVKSPIVVDL